MPSKSPDLDRVSFMKIKIIAPWVLVDQRHAGGISLGNWSQSDRNIQN